MGFASSWLPERTLFPEFIQEKPDNKTGIIVVVPAYNEPGITVLLNSLALCRQPDCKVEVIIVVNAPLGAPECYLINNHQTLENIQSWKESNKNCFFRLYSFIAEPTSTEWGVGMARKTGMDEALRRFNRIGEPNGVILSLDADCTVRSDYFTAVCGELFQRNDRSACSIYFEHPLSGKEFSPAIYESIASYELHLRYFLQGMIYSGYPYAFHTVGSAMAVKALPYVKAGGMNRKQAGEDFYFIQKLVPSGSYFCLNSTIVYPSPRTSFRVPFGTGASMEKLTGKNNSSLLTYNLLSFMDLHQFFSRTDDLYNCKPEELKYCYNSLPENIRLFCAEDEWTTKLSEIKENTSGLSSFKKRFFIWFNMFRIVRYLNFVHQDIMDKQPVAEAAQALLKYSGEEHKNNGIIDLLMIYRMKEK